MRHGVPAHLWCDPPRHQARGATACQRNQYALCALFCASGCLCCRAVCLPHAAHNASGPDRSVSTTSAASQLVLDLPRKRQLKCAAMQNTLIGGTKPGTLVKICDFGYSKRPEVEQSQCKSVVGTPAYLAPEVRASATLLPLLEILRSCTGFGACAQRRCGHQCPGLKTRTDCQETH